MSAPIESRFPGESLGLPAEGPRSIARFGRRLVGLVIDWGLAWTISVAFFPIAPFQSQWWIQLLVYGAIHILFLLFFNGAPGHLLLGMRVVPAEGGRMRIWQPFVRTALLCLAIPPLILDENQRGVHDRAALTLLVRV